VQPDACGLRQMGLTTWMTDVGPVDFLDGLKDNDGRSNANSLYRAPLRGVWHRRSNAG
jgi:hypothetical protein